MESAIRSLGITGGSDVTTALVAIYNSQAAPEIKKQVVHSLFIHGDAKDLIALARKETNPELKSYLVHYISLTQSPEAADYMMEILNK